MAKEEIVLLGPAMDSLDSLEELERRLECACAPIDPCLAQYCWQFGSEYGCPSECAVQCQPFGGCDPYCCE